MHKPTQANRPVQCVRLCISLFARLDKYLPVLYIISLKQEVQSVRMSFSSVSLPGLGEMEQIICSLERGTLIQKFYPRRKPEKKTLMLRRETRQVSVGRLMKWGGNTKHVINSMFPLIYTFYVIRCVRSRGASWHFGYTHPKGGQN